MATYGGCTSGGNPASLQKGKGGCRDRQQVLEKEDDRMPRSSLQTRTEILSECYQARVKLLFQLEKSISFVTSAYEP